MEEDRLGRLRALRVLLDRDHDHHTGQLVLHSTHGDERRRHLRSEHNLNDLAHAYAHGDYGKHQEEIDQLLEAHFKKHHVRLNKDDATKSNHATHLAVVKKLARRKIVRGEARTSKGMKWTRDNGLPPLGLHHERALRAKHGRDLGFIKDFGFSWKTGLNGEIGFYEHKVLFEIGNPEMGAEAYATTDDLAFISIPMFGKTRFGVRVHNEAKIH